MTTLAQEPQEAQERTGIRSVESGLILRLKSSRKSLEFSTFETGIGHVYDLGKLCRIKYLLSIKLFTERNEGCISQVPCHRYTTEIAPSIRDVLQILRISTHSHSGGTRIDKWMDGNFFITCMQ